MHGTAKVADKYWAFAEAKAQHLVEQHWKQIESVAGALIKRGVITSAALAKFMV